MAVVKVENKTYIADPLYQWDKNQGLEIRGLSLARVPEVHFSNTFMDRAIPRPASMDAAGVVTTQVPNSLLQQASRIIAYICDYEGDTFQTLYKLEIPVRARPRPSDYTFEDDAGEIYSFNALETAVANALTAADDAKGRYDSAAKDLADCKVLLDQATALCAAAEQRYSNAAATLGGVEDGSVFLKKAGDEMAGVINMNNHTITGLADPDGDTDAVPKAYVDAIVPSADLLWENLDISTGWKEQGISFVAYENMPYVENLNNYGFILLQWLHDADAIIPAARTRMGETLMAVTGEHKVIECSDFYTDTGLVHLKREFFIDADSIHFYVCEAQCSKEDADLANTDHRIVPYRIYGLFRKKEATG